MIDQDIQSRVDAYRGNPQALQQKYAQNQQLIDLLALQRLKSEKESAAREMALKMGGQGGQKPTIAQQREQEVLDMTKQEVAQEQGGVAAHQQKQQQDAMKALLQQQQQGAQQVPQPMQQAPQQPQPGIAQLPAPNISAQGMATGGIVAFDEGGETETEEQRQARMRTETSRTPLGLTPEMLMRLREGKTGVTDTLKALPEKIREAAPPAGAFNLAAPGAVPPRPSPEANAAADAAKARDESTLLANAQAPQPQPDGVATPPIAKPVAPPTAGGIGVLPAGGTDAFGSKVKSAAEGLMGLDHVAEAKRVREQQMEFAGLTPEQKAKKEKMLADVEAYDKQAYSPENKRWDSVIQFLLGAGGRSAGQELGGAGRAVVNNDNKVREMERLRMNERNKQQNEYINLEREIREGAFGAGEKASKEALAGIAHGVTAGANLYHTDTQAAVERMKVGIMAEANKIAKGAASTDKARAQLETFTSHRNAEKLKIDEAFRKDAGMLLQIAASGGTLTPAQEKQLNLLQAQKNEKLADFDNRSAPLRRQIESQLEIGGSGWGKVTTSK